MDNVKVGSIVIYENRKCLVVERSDDKVTLKNLEVKGDSDWTYLQISITNIEEDTKNE